MADFKISDLSESSSAAATDLTVISQDLGGSNYDSKKMTFNNLQRSITDLGSSKSAINKTTIESDGTLVFNGDATPWQSVWVRPMSAGKGANPPGLTLFKNDGGTSTGVYAEAFDRNTIEQLYFSVQLPRGWKEGTVIYPYYHWAPSSAASGVVIWGLEYTWQNVNFSFGNTTLVTSSQGTGGSDRHHSILSIGAGISGVGKTISSLLLCRVYRKANDVLDTYNADAFLLSIEFRYEVDTIGSRQKEIK